MSAPRKAEEIRRLDRRSVVRSCTWLQSLKLLTPDQVIQVIRLYDDTEVTPAELIGAVTITIAECRPWVQLRGVLGNQVEREATVYRPCEPANQ